MAGTLQTLMVYKHLVSTSYAHCQPALNPTGPLPHPVPCLPQNGPVCQWHHRSSTPQSFSLSSLSLSSLSSLSFLSFVSSLSCLSSIFLLFYVSSLSLPSRFFFFIFRVFFVLSVFFFVFIFFCFYFSLFSLFSSSLFFWSASGFSSISSFSSLSLLLASLILLYFPSGLPPPLPTLFLIFLFWPIVSLTFFRPFSDSPSDFFWPRTRTK